MKLLLLIGSFLFSQTTSKIEQWVDDVNDPFGRYYIHTQATVFKGEHKSIVYYTTYFTLSADTATVKEREISNAKKEVNKFTTQLKQKT